MQKNRPYHYAYNYASLLGLCFFHDFKKIVNVSSKLPFVVFLQQSVASSTVSYNPLVLLVIEYFRYSAWLLVRTRLPVVLVLLQWKNSSCKLARFLSLTPFHYDFLVWQLFPWEVDQSVAWLFILKGLFPLFYKVLEGKSPTCQIFKQQVCQFLAAVYLPLWQISYCVQSSFPIPWKNIVSLSPERLSPSAVCF